MIVSNLGVLALKLEDYDSAERYVGRALALAQAVKDKVNTMIALINLGEISHHRHDLKLAAARFLEGLPLLQEIGDKVSVAATLEMIAFLLIDRGNVDGGLCLLGAAEAQREILNSPIIPRDRPRYDQFLAAAREQRNTDDFQSAWVAGRKLSLDEAVAFALNRLHA
jgi:hypothetical protein